MTEKRISQDEAKELVEYWISSGMLEKWMSDPEMLAIEAKLTALFESGQFSEPLSPVAEVMRQFKKGATKEEMAKAIENISYTEEIFEDNSYIEIITHKNN